MSEITQTAIAPWFGSNRTLAENVGRALEGCRWVGVPFAGGMSELLHIQAPSVVVSDLHTHVLNLAAVIAHPGLNPQLRERLDGLPCHPDVLAAAQARCRERERCQDDEWFGVGLTTCEPDLDWAVDYFVCAWLSRNGCAGTKGEFNAGHSVRWDAGGGDSATRFRNATDGLAAWQGVMRFCSFVRLDVFKFLLEVKDEPEHGVYCDPPFPDVGDSYKFRFDEQDQRRLAKKLTGFKRLRVVVRFYDHPLVRALYLEPEWNWSRFEGRKQTNEKAREEVLLTRNGP
jgi:site-specific DNA-adenine methylase